MGHIGNNKMKFRIKASDMESFLMQEKRAYIIREGKKYSWINPEKHLLCSFHNLTAAHKMS